MTNLDKYGTAHQNKLRLDFEEADIQMTSQKQNKYYSTQENDGTIRKKLIQHYPQVAEENANPTDNEGSKGPSTKYSQIALESTNGNLLGRLESSLHHYQLNFGEKTELKKINFTELDLDCCVPALKKKLEEAPIAEMNPKIQLKERLQRQKMLIEGASRVEEVPSSMRKVKGVDKDIAALYKQNRDVNLEYRRGKFIQLFTGERRKGYLQSQF